MDAPLELIQARIASPGWTPGKRDIEALFAVWRSLEDHERESMEKRLAKLDAPSALLAAKIFAGLDARSRGELARPLLKSFLKVGQTQNQIEFPRSCLNDHETRVRKAAAQAIGSSWGDLLGEVKRQLVDLLLDKLPAVSDQSEKKAMIDALGKCGDARALSAIKAAGSASGKAVLTLERDAQRGNVSEDSCLPELVRGQGVVLWFTPGIEQVARRYTSLLGAEMLTTGVLKPEALEWSQIENINLWRKAGLAIGRDKEQTPASLANALNRVAESLRAATKIKSNGPVRVRLGRSDDRSRSFVWDFAEELSKLNCGLLNDGRSAHWELRTAGEWLVVLPMAYTDRRFAWRDAELEGASDPTIASALIELAQIKSGDVVYDPFCGAATELILAKLGAPGAHAYGTDISEKAIIAGREACGRAHVKIDLKLADALTFKTSERFNVVVTNPPFGMRTLRGEARGVLDEFLRGIRTRLAPGGRVVLLSPAPVATAQWAEAGMLRMQHATPVRLGAMGCELQSFVMR